MVKNSTPIPVRPVHRTAALLIVRGVSPGGCSCSSNCMPVKGRITLSTRHPLTDKSFKDALYRNLSLWTNVLDMETGKRGNLRTTIGGL